MTNFDFIDVFFFRKFAAAKCFDNVLLIFHEIFVPVNGKNHS